jgi:hypothetical protein
MPKKTYTQINSVTLAAASGSVTFGSIPQNFRDLVLVIRTPAFADGFQLRLNADSSNNSSVIAYGYSVSSSFFSYTDSAIRGTTGSNIPRQFTYNIMDYSATDKHKTVLGRGSESIDSVLMSASRWASTSQVTSLLLVAQSSGSFPTGSTFSLYGIEA